MIVERLATHLVRPIGVEILIRLLLEVLAGNDRYKVVWLGLVDVLRDFELGGGERVRDLYLRLSRLRDQSQERRGQLASVSLLRMISRLSEAHWGLGRGEATRSEMGATSITRCAQGDGIWCRSSNSGAADLRCTSNGGQYSLLQPPNRRRRCPLHGHTPPYTPRSPRGGLPQRLASIVQRPPRTDSQPVRPHRVDADVATNVASAASRSHPAL